MANVAPANVAKEFRSMLIRVAQQLTEDEIIRMYFEEGVSCSIPPGLQNVRIHLLHKLEAKGVFSPKNPEGFVNLLKRLPREDLVVEVNKYTQTHLRPNIFIKLKTALMKRSVPEVKQLLPTSDDQKNSQENLEDLFALAMTHASCLISMLDELRELMQQPLPREKLAAITPQVKEAIAVISKEEKIVIPIYEKLKKIAATEIKTDENKNENGNVERYKKFSFSSRGQHTTLSRAKSTEILSPKSVHPLPEVEIMSSGSPKRKTLTRSLTLEPKRSSQYSDHDYSEITTMVTMGEGYSNYDQVPVRTQPVVENSAIYDEVADYLTEGSPKQTTKDFESKSDPYIFMTPRPAGTSSTSKSSPKPGGRKEAAIDWLSKLKKKTGTSPAASPPPLPEDRKNSKSTKPKWSPYTKLMILDDKEEGDYAELVKTADQPQSTKQAEADKTSEQSQSTEQLQSTEEAERIKQPQSAKKPKKLS